MSLDAMHSIYPTLLTFMVSFELKTGALSAFFFGLASLNFSLGYLIIVVCVPSS